VDLYLSDSQTKEWMQQIQIGPNPGFFFTLYSRLMYDQSGVKGLKRFGNGINAVHKTGLFITGFGDFKVFKGPFTNTYSIFLAFSLQLDMEEVCIRLKVKVP